MFLCVVSVGLRLVAWRRGQQGNAGGADLRPGHCSADHLEGPWCPPKVLTVCVREERTPVNMFKQWPSMAFRKYTPPRNFFLLFKNEIYFGLLNFPLYFLHLCSPPSVRHIEGDLCFEFVMQDGDDFPTLCVSDEDRAAFGRQPQQLRGSESR